MKVQLASIKRIVAECYYCPGSKSSSGGRYLSVRRTPASNSSVFLWMRSRKDPSCAQTLIFMSIDSVFMIIFPAFCDFDIRLFKYLRTTTDGHHEIAYILDNLMWTCMRLEVDLLQIQLLFGEIPKQILSISTCIHS